jgi:hypothetical protein
MKRSLSVTAAAVFFIGISLVDALAGLAQAPAVEYQVKAVYLFNFAKFVEWPQQAFLNPKTPYTICLAGDPFDTALQKTVQGESVNGRALAVRRLAAGDSPAGCHLLYISRSEAARTADLLNAVSSAPVLTVGESDEFINNGGMVRFVEAGGRIRFEINPDAAEQGSLKVSSRLLRLADIVKPRQRAGKP